MVSTHGPRPDGLARPAGHGPAPDSPATAAQAVPDCMSGTCAILGLPVRTPSGQARVPSVLGRRRRPHTVSLPKKSTVCGSPDVQGVSEMGADDDDDDVEYDGEPLSPDVVAYMEERICQLEKQNEHLAADNKAAFLMLQEQKTRMGASGDARKLKSLEQENAGLKAYLEEQEAKLNNARMALRVKEKMIRSRDAQVLELQAQVEALQQQLSGEANTQS